MRAERLAALGWAGGRRRARAEHAAGQRGAGGERHARAREFPSARRPPVADALVFARVARDLRRAGTQPGARRAGSAASSRSRSTSPATSGADSSSPRWWRDRARAQPLARRSGVELVDRTPSGQGWTALPRPAGPGADQPGEQRDAARLRRAPAAAITIGAEVAEGGQVRLTVADDGTGIAPG